MEKYRAKISVAVFNTAKVIFYIIGVVVNLVAFIPLTVDFFKNNKITSPAYSVIFLVFTTTMGLITFFAFKFLSTKTKFLTSLSSISSQLHQIAHKLRDEISILNSIEKEATLTMLKRRRRESCSALLENISKLASEYNSGKKCTVSIKLISDDNQVYTIARTNKQGKSKDYDKNNNPIKYVIRDFTAFSRILEGADYYVNGDIDDSVNSPGERYKSKIAVPIRCMNEGEQGSPPSVIGFLCINCYESNPEWKNNQHPIISFALMCADILFTYLIRFDTIILEREAKYSISDREVTDVE